MKYLFVSLLFLFGTLSDFAFAEDVPILQPPITEVAEETKPALPAKKISKQPKKKKTKPASQIEGTKALDKGEIEAEPVIRSHYDKNGEKLEVDPD